MLPIVSILHVTTTIAQLTTTVSNTVPKESYDHYTISTKGNIILKLHSLTGDSDLYVSENNRIPTYDDYNFHSATCGTDIVEVPAESVRPICVAVYGHPSHDNSTYVLEVRENGGEEITEDWRLGRKWRSVLGKCGLWALLEVFEMVFL